LTLAQEQQIVELTKANRWKTWSELSKMFEDLNPGVKCGRDRFREVCWLHGVKGFVARKKPFISAEAAKKRLNFALKYQHYTATDWESVLFLDESKIDLWGNDCGKGVYVKCGVDSKNKPECCKQVKKHGGGKNIKFWGCAWSYGAGDLVKIEGNMTGPDYC